MIKVRRMTGNNVRQLQSLYARFSARAKDDYHWGDVPIDFETFCWSIQSGWLNGYYFENAGAGTIAGFMIYRRETHRAIEINLLHWEPEEGKVFLAALMPRFIADILEFDDWDVVSYAMLGRQARFIRTITWYGFKALGQTIFKFDSLDIIHLQIMQKQSSALPGPEYRISPWMPQYADDVALCVYEAFLHSADACWDPRFRTLEGCRGVMTLLEQGLMGRLRPECTSILLKEEIPVGFCFLIEGGPTSGNIPLVGIRPSESRRGLGRVLLRNTLRCVIDETVAGRASMFTVDATTDTDNFSAIAMYRRLGFQEEHNYPHAYLTREKALAYKPGQWC